MSFGEGERGLENGCEMPVEIAEAWVEDWGEAVSVEGVRSDICDENTRMDAPFDCSDEARRRQERQIILRWWVGGIDVRVAVARAVTFWSRVLR